MRPRRVRFNFQSAVLVMALSSGCAHVDAPPETSPIAENGVVGGRVVMDAPRDAAQPVLVTVAGTAMTANVGGLGDFVLPNVPAGPLELRFSGGGVAASLPLDEIAGRETVTLTVRLAPNAATLESISRVRGTDALLEGVIESSALAAGSLIVGGRSVALTAGTSVRRGAAAAGVDDLTPGVRVRIAGAVSAAGITAREIVIL